MILQNTVDPRGHLQRSETRIVSFMGNRGILHDDDRNIVKPWAHKSWVCCSTSYKSIDRRPLFRTPPNRYSELFFLDEVTAYAAGHRPCNYCRREAFQNFKQFWCMANKPGVTSDSISAKEIDAQIHSERATKGREKMTFFAPISELPVGAMFEIEDAFYAVGVGSFLRWSFNGYHQCKLNINGDVTVLTPRSVVEAFRIGLRPMFHKSAY